MADDNAHPTRKADEALTAAQEMREKYADRIKEIVDKAPPLTEEQRTKLALLLRPGGQA